MTCLDCGKEMASYEVHTSSTTATYDVCEACGGLWLDKGQLDKVADQVAGDIEYCSTEEAEAATPASDKICPRCPSEHLIKVKFLGDDAIILERCDNCHGFWLDGGQIDRIDKQLAGIMPVRSQGLSAFIANTHLPHYNYTTRDSAETDFIVPVLPVPDARHIGTAKHKCPDHEFFLDIWEAYGMKFETCPKCAGLWLHEKELKVLKDKTDDGNLRWMNDEIAAIDKTSGIASKRLCPQDRVSLLSTHFGNSGITIEHCATCHGVWLDRDEFNDIVRYLEDELIHETSADMKKKVAEEVGRIRTDRSESTLSEILDAKSAISALIGVSIFDHPKLASFLLQANKAERVIGGN
jgi:Zn-finger nucleic acid-binding protein